MVFNWAEGGKTPPLTYDRIAALGFKLIICPISTLLAATGVMRHALAQIKTAGIPAAAIAHELMAFAEFTDFIGLLEINELEKRFNA